MNGEKNGNGRSGRLWAGLVLIYRVTAFRASQSRLDACDLTSYLIRLPCYGGASSWTVQNAITAQIAAGKVVRGARKAGPGATWTEGNYM